MLVIGPIPRRDGGHAFDTIGGGEILRRGFVCQRVEDARYVRDRETERRDFAVVVGEAFADFIAQLPHPALAA